MTRIVSIRDDPGSALEIGCTCLLNAEVVAFPTETVYGIGVSPTAPGGEERLRRVKGRDGDKPFQVLLSDASYVEQFGGVLSETTERLLTRFTPGPLTVIIPQAQGGTLGIRIPDHAFVRDLIASIGGALVATSANKAGKPVAQTATDIAQIFGDSVAAILDGGPAPLGLASTVVLVESHALRVLREGCISANDLHQATGLPVHK